ncbi:ABC transporter ATP-binding protein [Chroococcidiopsis sp. CCMEE 29]|uniref:ABC transporter ATP-binding protein n=1 Tax=Chroococcidiopsis sp. CCMEE 29 TaxID=155894 RepID=UPI0020215D94|nr:ABC transporter ATP-binding protein [Chroococcidiopsis sp. CCMEE 29]
MGEEIAISLKHVSKVYKRYARPVDRLKEILLPGKSRADEFWALRDISLEVPRGQTIGILGQNGSGKSTLLQIIAGTLTPTTGEVKVNGRLSALLELGSGFNPEFTGKQNVFFNGRMLGLSQEEIENKFDEIAAFADIGDFLDQPVKTYSSGMYVRLAFSVAINVNPDILIVDEALAVGDARFQQRCMTRINQLRNEGVSILFVSHDADAVKRLCDQAVVLEKGKIVNQGLALQMVNWYLALITVDFNLEKLREIEESSKKRDELLPLQANGNDLEAINALNLNERSSKSQLNSFTKQMAVSDKKSDFEKLNVNNNYASLPEFKYFRHGDGNARIKNIILKNSQGQEVDYVYLGEEVKVYVEVEFLSNQHEYLIGILVRDRLGTDIVGINTYQERLQLPKVAKGEKFFYCFSFPIHIKPGAYSISPSVAYDQYSLKWLDWIDNALVFRVIDMEAKRMVFGIYHPPNRDLEIIKVAEG